MIENDCFAYDAGECSVLCEMLCSYRNCPFYKTDEQLKEERRKAKNRIKEQSGIKDEVNK